MRLLTLPAHTLDHSQDFILNYIDRKGSRARMACYLWTHGDECGINQRSSMVKDNYTAAERAHTADLITQVGISNGDTVEVNGKLYKVKVNGNFSDAANLIAL